MTAVDRPLTQVHVGMGEIVALRRSEVAIMALGIGSCVVICAYDTLAGVAGMAHVLLPVLLGNSQEESSPARSAPQAVPNLLARMEELGASHQRIRTAVIGGASLFNDGGNDIGRRNIDAVLTTLEQCHLYPVAQDVGGRKGRSVRFHASTGTVWRRTVGQPDSLLVELGVRRRQPNA